MSETRIAEPHVESHFQDWENERHSGHLAMWIFITTEVLFFTALFGLYAGFRAEYPNDFEAAAKHSKLYIGTANTYILITSSLFVALMIDAFRKDRIKRALVLQCLTILFALTFLFLKFYEYSEHFKEGIYPGMAYRSAEIPQHGALLFFTMYYVMTGLHALHVSIGVGLFIWLIVRTAKGKYSSKTHLGPTLVGIYWHFVDLVWIFLWPLFYLIR